MTSRRISITIDEQGANRVARELNKVNTIGDKVSAGFKRMTSGIKAFAKSALITTAVITGLVYAASRLARAVFTPFMRLETTMARIRIASGATIEEIRMMTDVVGQLGRDTHFSAAEAAEGMLLLAKAGLDVKQNIAAIPGVLQAAIVEELDLGTAADIVTGLLNEFSLAANQAGFAADVLAKGSNLAKTNMPEMSEALKYFGTTAFELGYDIQHAVAMLDVLAGKMIRGSMAGTAMRQSLILFQKTQAAGVFTTKAQIDAIGRLGLDAGKLAKQISAGDLTFMSFISTLKKAGATTGDFASIFEQRAAVAVNALAEAAETAFPKYVNELNNAVGFTEKAAKTLADTLDEQMRQVNSSIEGFTNALAETVAPALRGFLENKLRPFINDMTEAWKNGGDTIKDKIQSVADFIAPTFRSGIEEAIDTIKELAPSLGREIGIASTKIAGEILKGAYGALSQLRYGVPVGGWDFQEVAPPAGSFASGNVRIQDITDLLKYLKTPTVAGMASYNQLPEVGWQELIDLLKTMPDTLTAKALAMSYPEIASRVTPHSLTPFGSGQAIGTLSSIVSDLSFAVKENTDVLLNPPPPSPATEGGLGEAASGFMKQVGDQMLGSLESTLFSAITDPVTSALDKYLGPTSNKIGQLTDRVLRLFDFPMSGINAALGWAVDLMGGPSYTQGRYTHEGAYAYAGGGDSGGGDGGGAGGFHIHGNLEVNGYRDGEEVGAAVIEEIQRHEEISTRVTARSLKRGMLKREAMER